MKILPAALLVFTVTTLWGGCSSFSDESVEDRPVARVHDRQLFESDLAGVVPEGTQKEDSIEMASNYIQSWIRQTLLVHKAESNLIQDQKEIQKQLENYRNSLVIYAFEKELVRQRLDTNISDSEIEEYYKNNQGNFELKDYIVKVLYVKLDKQTPELPKYRRWIVSDKDEDRFNLEDYCRQFAVNYYLDDESWLFFDDLLKEIPIETYNKEKFLKNSKLVEFEDEAHLYLLHVKDYQLKDSTSPLSLERDKIRNIILNQRKLDLINEMKETLYEDAEINGHFEVFN